MRFPTLAFVLVFTAPVLAMPTTTRSVRTALGTDAEFPSGFRVQAGCQDALLLLGSSAEGFAALELRERVRRLHALAFLMQSPGPVPPALTREVIARLIELGTVDHKRLAQYHHELLVVIARLAPLLRDRPERPSDTYFGIRTFIEVVVNLRHEDSQAEHALIAHALGRLAEMRVSRLRHVARFDEQIREAFEDLDRLHREDVLGDNELLRLHASLAVFAQVIPAVTMYDSSERPRRATELVEHLIPVEEAVRALVNRRVPADDLRTRTVLEKLEAALGARNIELLPEVRERLLTFKKIITARSPAQ